MGDFDNPEDDPDYSPRLTNSGPDDDELPRVATYISAEVGAVLRSHQHGQLAAVDMTGGYWMTTLHVRDDLTLEEAEACVHWARVAVRQLFKTNDPEGDGWDRSSEPNRWYTTCAVYEL